MSILVIAGVVALLLVVIAVVVVAFAIDCATVWDRPGGDIDIRGDS